MLLKKFKIVNGEVFVKVPWNVGCCLDVCDYYTSGKACVLYDNCVKANKILGPSFYETPSGASLELQYSYWIPKGHLLPK